MTTRTHTHTHTLSLYKTQTDTNAENLVGSYKLKVSWPHAHIHTHTHTLSLSTKHRQIQMLKIWLWVTNWRFHDHIPFLETWNVILGFILFLHTHTHRVTHTESHTHTHTNTQSHAHTNTLMHIHTSDPQCMNDDPQATKLSLIQCTNTSSWMHEWQTTMAQARDLRYSVPILHPGHITDELQATADKALIQCTDTNTSPLKHEWWTTGHKALTQHTDTSSWIHEWWTTSQKLTNDILTLHPGYMNDEPHLKSWQTTYWHFSLDTWMMNHISKADKRHTDTSAWIHERWTTSQKLTNFSLDTWMMNHISKADKRHTDTSAWIHERWTTSQKLTNDILILHPRYMNDEP